MLKFDIKCLFLLFWFSMMCRAIIRPIGIEGCRSVDNRNQCMQCQDGYRLVKKVCIRVLSPIQSVNRKKITGKETDTKVLVTQNKTQNSTNDYNNSPGKNKQTDKNVTVVKQKQKVIKKSESAAPQILLTGCMEQANGVCLRCAYRYIVSNGFCKTISDQCKTWDQVSGDCSDCYGGYVLLSGVCVMERLDIPQVGCMEQVRGVCLSCAYRYFNQNGVCKEVSGLCRSWNQKTGACTECYGGYKVAQSTCVIDNGPAPAPLLPSVITPSMNKIPYSISLPSGISASIISITSNKYPTISQNPNINTQSIPQNKVSQPTKVTDFQVNSSTRSSSSPVDSVKFNPITDTTANPETSSKQQQSTTQTPSKTQQKIGPNTPTNNPQSIYFPQSVVKPIIMQTDTASFPANESPDFSIDSWLASMSHSHDESVANSLIASILQQENNKIK